jgi:hypothetical protein
MKYNQYIDVQVLGLKDHATVGLEAFEHHYNIIFECPSLFVLLVYIVSEWNEMVAFNRFVACSYQMVIFLFQ